MPSPPWCSQSGRVLPGFDWTSHVRVRCGECRKRVTLVAGRVPKHRRPGVLVK